MRDLVAPEGVLPLPLDGSTQIREDFALRLPLYYGGRLELFQYAIALGQPLVKLPRLLLYGAPFARQLRELAVRQAEPLLLRIRSA